VTTAAACRHAGAVVAAALGLALLAACGTSDGAAGADDEITITDAWARATPPGTSVGAVYFAVTSGRDETLVGATVDRAIAGSATLHTTTTDTSGRTSMEALPALEVPAGEEVVLEPAGDHVMLVDLAAPLDDGDTFELTLTFATAGEQTVGVEVR